MKQVKWIILFFVAIAVSFTRSSIVATEMVYPPMGVPSSTGSQWGASYTVGTGKNNLVQLDALGRLPSLDGSLLFNIAGGASMIYPAVGVPTSTGSAWGRSYAVGINPNNLVQLDSSGRLPELDGSQLGNLTNLIFNYFTNPLMPGQIAIDTQTGALVFHPGGGAPQQALIFNGECPAGDTLVSDGHGLWTCGKAAGTYPPVGVPSSTGSDWGSSYSVGTAANNLIQLDGSARLPAVDGSQLKNLPVQNQSYYNTVQQEAMPLPQRPILRFTGRGVLATDCASENITLVNVDLPAAGVANSNGTTWGASYGVGTAANNLVQLDSNARLPAVDGSQLTNLPSSLVYPSAGISVSAGSAWGSSIPMGSPWQVLRVKADSSSGYAWTNNYTRIVTAEPSLAQLVLSPAYVSNTILTNTNQAANFSFMLPSVEEGMRFMVFVSEIPKGGPFSIEAQEAAGIIWINTNGSMSTVKTITLPQNTSSGVGSQLSCFACNSSAGLKWFCRNNGGPWTGK